jgi:hypothetical protein
LISQQVADTKYTQDVGILFKNGKRERLSQSGPTVINVKKTNLGRHFRKYMSIFFYITGHSDPFVCIHNDFLVFSPDVVKPYIKILYFLYFLFADATF